MARPTWNLAPNPDFGERYTNVYETKIAPDRPGQSGPRRAEEQLLAHDLDVAPSFYGGVAVDLNATVPPYERRQAGQAFGRGPLAAGNPAPSWTDESSYLASFASGAQQRGPSAPQTGVRPGASPTLGPAARVPERSPQHWFRTVATPNRVVNQAEVTD